MKSESKEYGSILACGGKGSRLSDLTGPEIPKALFKVCDKELIRYTIDHFDPAVVCRLVFAIGYQGEEIRHWAVNAGLPYQLDFSEQSQPGVLDAIVSGSKKVKEESMIACNTDEIREGLNMEAAIKFHESRDTLATMVVTTANHLDRHGLVTVDRNGLISELKLKPEEYHSQPHKSGLVNTGFLLIEKEAIDLFDIDHDPDWMGIIDPLCGAGQLSAFIDNDIRYFNVGTKEEYLEASSYLQRG